MVFFATNEMTDFDTHGLMFMSNTPVQFDNSVMSRAMFYDSGSDTIFDKTLENDTNIIWCHFVTEFTSSGRTNIWGYQNDWLSFIDLDGNKVAGLYRGSSSSNSFSTRAQSATIVSSGEIGVSLTRTIWDVCVDMTGSNIVVSTYLNRVLTHTVTVAKGTRKNIKKVEWRPAGLRYNWINLCLSEFILSPTSTLGQRVATLLPNTNGSLTEMLGNVSDLLDAGDGLGLETNAPNQRHTWNPTAYGGPSKPIAALQVSLIAERSDGSPSVVAPFFRKSGLNYDGLNILVGANTKGRQIWTINPITGLPWTIADLTGLEIGLKSGA